MQSPNKYKLLRHVKAKKKNAIENSKMPCAPTNLMSRTTQENILTLQKD